MTITDLLCFLISFNNFDLPTRALWQQPTETPGSKAGETWREMSVNFIYKYLYRTEGIFNTPALLPLRRKSCSDFYRPQKINRRRPGLIPRTLDPVPSTITTRPLRAT
jgi:hypothetical protein